jgi:hypothetical protein
MNHRASMFAFMLAASLAGAVGAQVVGYNFRTGDAWVDTQLVQVNDYGLRDRAYFVDDVVNTFGAPRYLVNELLGARRWNPGDVYYACALAYSARRPCGDVVRYHDEAKGQGWGVVAKRMGIKPGSAEFHALKGNLGKSNGRYKSRGGPPKNDVDGSGPGNSGKGNSEGSGPGNSGKGNSGNSGDSGDPGKGKSKGNSGKSKGHGA